MNRVLLYQPTGSNVPPFPPIAELVKMRGAIWPKLGLDSPWGPRPHQPDNISMIDYMEIFPPVEQDLMMSSYVGCGRGYNTASMGPIWDNGYHGQIPSTDPSLWNFYLDAAEKWWRDYQVRVVHFLRPDAGVNGLEWTVEDLDRELTPLFSQPRAQALMKIVCLGWEPGGRYHYDNSWWVKMCQWMARVFPNALRCLHTPPDEDAPVGGGDDGHPDLAAWAWGNVAPYIHCWLVQNAGYTDTGNTVPSPDFVKEFNKQWDIHAVGSLYDRFQFGYAGWPTFSAWGSDQGIIALPFEYAAYGLYWNNYKVSNVHGLSDGALAVGAVGFMDDGGNVSY